MSSVEDQEQLLATPPPVVLVLAPTTRDAASTCNFLSTSGIPSEVCGDIEAACDALARRPGIVLVTDEVLAKDGLTRLAHGLGRLAYGRDVPVLVLIAPRREPPAAELVRTFTRVLANPILLTRPVHPITLVSAVESARRTVAERRARVTAAEDAARYAPEPDILAALHTIPLTLFAQDRALRYTWIHNPFGQRPAADFIGRTDAEWLGPGGEAEALEAFKRRALENGAGGRERLRLTLPDGVHHYEVSVAPRHNGREAVGLVGAALAIDEHVALQERLRRQADQLARMDQRKNDFIAQLAHELRNPLAPIHNALHVLRIQPSPPDPGHFRWATDVIGRQLMQLSRLVDDLLDIARMTHGSLRLRTETIELGSALLPAIEAARPLTAARKQTLTYSPPIEPVRVQADPARLLQIAGNLLSNAARYTPSGGHIGLSVRRDERDAIITVVDDGQGIPRDVLPHIFDPFYRGRDATAQTQAGLGLGLALVRELVQLHGGRIEAHSDGPDCGSEFTVRLPLLDKAPAVPLPPPVTAEATRGLRVLVVDDDPDVAHSFVLLLQTMGYQAEAVGDGAEAFAAVARFRPRVVFIDIGLPDMDGFRLAERLRAAQGRSRLYLVAVTGYAQDDVRRRAAAAGFDAHVAKPTTAEAVEGLLAPLLAE
ncbi:MAG TPA: ATP-binding protein [Burkholderiales bacterium]